MQKSTYLYEKEDLGLTIGKLPIWYVESECTGDKQQATINFYTKNEYDEIWGPISKIEISWDKKGRSETYHAKEVQKSIDIYNSIKIVVTKKETIWVRSHEFTYWFGSRTKIIRKKFYPEMSIHGIFYCDISERVIDIHVAVIKEHFEGFKPYIIDMFNTIICH